MEPVIGLAGFEAFPNPREGFDMLFSGNVPNDEGDPDGARVEITLTVPPLDFYSQRRLQIKQKARTSAPTLGEINADIVDTICLALKRNYRGVPRWLVEQSMDGPHLSGLFSKMREMVGEAELKKESGTNP